MEFAFACLLRGTRQSNCRRCHSRLRRLHYLRNRQRYHDQAVAQLARRRRENRDRIFDYLRAHPCVDCGESRIVVLEFDHRDPSEKSKPVKVLVAGRSWSRVLVEIEKCEVRCANCHRRRTARQFGWKKLEASAHVPLPSTPNRSGKMGVARE